jgi:hypothetical protein
VVVWLEFVATDPEVPGSIPRHYQIFWERGLPSLVSTIEELLDRKVAAPV